MPGSWSRKVDAGVWWHEHSGLEIHELTEGGSEISGGRSQIFRGGLDQAERGFALAARDIEKFRGNGQLDTSDLLGMPEAQRCTDWTD